MKPPRPPLSLLSALLATALTLAAAPPPTSAQDLFLRGGHLVDPRTRTVERGNLLILDGVIAGRPEAPPEGFSGEVMKASGKWIVPGLRDLHVHSMVNTPPEGRPQVLGTPETARRMLYAGVTGFLDLFNDEAYVLNLRDEWLLQGPAERARAADLFAAGPCVTAPGGHCTEYRIATRVIDSPQAARREIAELARRRPDVVKLVYAHAAPDMAGKSWRPERPSISRETLAAAVATAKEHGLPAVVHVRSWRDVREASEAGAAAVTHVPSHAVVPRQLARALAERGTVMIPTLSVGDPLLIGAEASASEDPWAEPLLRAVAGDKLRAVYGRFASSERAAAWRRAMPPAQEVRMESLARLAAAGVPLVAGTDAGNPLTVQGWSLHRELELMVEAGLSPWQALAAATTAAGDFLGRSWGLSPGSAGSVLVLDASPLEAITNTRRIHRVVHHGVVVDREVLTLDRGRDRPLTADDR